MKKKIAAIASGLALAASVAVGSLWLVDEYAHRETMDMANRQGLNGLLKPAAVDAYNTSKGVGLVGLILGAFSVGVIGSYFELLSQRDRKSQVEEPFAAYAREFLAQDIEEFRFWKSLQSIKSDRSPVETGKGIEQ